MELREINRRINFGYCGYVESWREVFWVVRIVCMRECYIVSILD